LVSIQWATGAVKSSLLDALEAGKPPKLDQLTGGGGRPRETHSIATPPERRIYGALTALKPCAGDITFGGR